MYACCMYLYATIYVYVCYAFILCIYITYVHIWIWSWYQTQLHVCMHAVRICMPPSMPMYAYMNLMFTYVHKYVHFSFCCQWMPVIVFWTFLVCVSVDASANCRRGCEKRSQDYGCFIWEWKCGTILWGIRRWWLCLYSHGVSPLSITSLGSTVPMCFISCSAN